MAIYLWRQLHKPNLSHTRVHIESSENSLRINIVIYVRNSQRLYLKSKSMKKSLAFFACIFIVSLATAQKGFAFDVGISTSKAPMVAVKYYFDKNAVFAGATYQVFNDALGPRHDELLPGSTGIDDGDYFYSIDVGYTRVLSDKFSIAGELSFGKRRYFWNFSKDDFTAGGYHWIHKTKSEFGGGGLLFYNFNQTFSLFAGYNSIREGTFGLEVRLFRDQQY